MKELTARMLAGELDAPPKIGDVSNQVLYGDAFSVLRSDKIPEGIVQTCVCSPPYFGLRSYLPPHHPAKAQEIGLEQAPEEYVAKLVDIFREVKRVLKADGTLWLVIGDTFWNQSPIRTSSAGAWEKKYTGGKISDGNGKRRSTKGHPTLKEKDLVGVPWMLASELRKDGWYLRADCIWSKTACMPSSATDRPTISHEYVFLFAKNEKYFYNAEGTRGDVWTIAPSRYDGDHPATFPPEVPAICIKAGSRPGDLVLDPFAGSGTTLEVAKDLGRDFIGFELCEAYRPLIESRTLPAIARAHERELFREMEMMGARDAERVLNANPAPPDPRPAATVLGVTRGVLEVMADLEGEPGEPV